MKRYPLIANFDGAKFGIRYGLVPVEGKFFVDGDGMLVVPDNLPDDPPIQEVSDPPPPSVAARLDKAKTLSDLITVLKSVLK